MADRMGADDCGNRESIVSTSTSISSGAPSSSGSSSPEDSRRSEEPKVFLQHMTSSEAASKNSPGRSTIWSSSWMSKYLRACNLLASTLRPQLRSYKNQNCEDHKFLSKQAKCEMRMRSIKTYFRRASGIHSKF